MNTINNHLDKIYPLLSEEELQNLARDFRDELIASLSNQPSSLPAILNPLAKTSPREGSGIAVSIGGSNGYASKFTINKKGDIHFHNRKSFILPVKTTQKDLFHLIARNIFALVDKNESHLPIGMGLAYTLKPLLVDKYLDGELIYMAKGREIKGLLGKKVGQEFHKFLKENYQIDTTVVVANDAIALLAAGDNVDVAGVVGTGLNFAYWDKRSAIAPLKLSTLPGFAKNEVAVNIESRNFDKIPANKLRGQVDKKSSDKGHSLAEKEASGAYLFSIFNEGKDTLVGPKMPKLNTSDELTDILNKSFIYPQNMTKDMKEDARAFAERILQKSAQIVALELCGIFLKLGKTEGIQPVVMDGGLFWRAKNYPSLVNSYCHGIALLAQGGIV